MFDHEQEEYLENTKKKYKHSFRVNKRDTQFNLCISKIHVKIIEIFWFREAVMRKKIQNFKEME